MADKLSTSGLSDATIKQIHHVFASHPEIDRVRLYGSRAKGNYRRGSDIDLAIMDEPPNQLSLLRIECELDELLLPYKIDLCLFRQIENRELAEHIERVGVDFYHRQRTVEQLRS